MSFKFKDVKGIIVLMENAEGGKALAMYAGDECLREFADALCEAENKKVNATMEGEPAQFFEMLLKAVKKS